MGQNSKPPEIYDANKREALICATFRRALNLEEEIAALVAEHIKPLKDDLKEAWGDAKAKLNMPTKDLKLQYRGRLDASRKKPVPNAPRDLFEAMKQVAQTGQGPREQIPSMGCSIKWKTSA